MSGAQSSREPLTSRCADSQIAIAHQARKVRRPVERLATLLRELTREVRCKVLGRLKEWQRLQLEQQLLRRGVTRGAALPSSSSSETRPSETLRRPAVQRRVAKRKARCKPLRESHGIFRRQTPGGQKFRASISFCNLRLQARPRSCMRDAERDLECLAAVRSQVLEHQSSFEDQVRII
mmetsp:Transcript_23305/g.27532  ORF Transcript_23305/g.27532 Transcript_23305/m.27532 type:complete len:179 (-) Transcript_23305:5-541(-)